MEKLVFSSKVPALVPEQASDLELHKLSKRTRLVRHDERRRYFAYYDSSRDMDMVCFRISERTTIETANLVVLNLISVHDSVMCIHADASKGRGTE